MRLRLSALAAALVGAALYLGSFVGDAQAVTTTITSTIVGVLAPDAQHLGYGLLAIILPLGGVAAFAALFKFLKMEGDAIILFLLVGLTVGAAFATLPASGASTNGIPFALIIVAGILTFLWWWNS